MYEKIVLSTDDSGQESLNSLEGYRKCQPMHNVYFVSSEDSGESNALISREFKLSWPAVSAELIYIPSNIYNKKELAHFELKYL